MRGPSHWHANFLTSDRLRNFIHRGEIMRKLFSVIAMGCLLSLLLVGSVQAQLPGTEIRASIPFDFSVRGITLPAGDYTITRIGDEPAGLLMRNIHDKRKHVLFETEPENGRR